jgi:hypothetical protein
MELVAVKGFIGSMITAKIWIGMTQHRFVMTTILFRVKVPIGAQRGPK